MLREKSFFKFFWATVEYFGLYYQHLTIGGKIRAIVMFALTAGVYFILFLIAIIVYDDIDSRLNGLQTFPFFIQILYDGSIFAAKGQKIQDLVNKIDDAFSKIGGSGEKIFKQQYRIFKIYAVYGAVSQTLATLSGILLFLLTGVIQVLTYVPYDHGFGFFVIWFAQTLYFIYTCLLNYLLDAFMVVLLILLSAYVKGMRDYIKTKDIRDMREIIELDLELRQLLRSYEDIYSTVILYRGFMSILTVSSLVLEILNGVSNNTFILCTFAFNILLRFFMPTYYGNEIQNDCAELLSDIYGFNWFEASVKERKDFIMVQENLKHDYRMRGAKIFSINLETFLTIINAAYSFYAVLSVFKN